MRRSCLVLVTFVMPALVGCQKAADLPAAAPKITLTDAEAIRIATAPMADWDKKGTQALDSQYAADAVGFEPHTASMVTGSPAWIKINKDLLAMKFDKVNVRKLKVQILNNDIFILSSDSDMTSTSGTVKSLSWRCTDVFQRQPDGKFRTVNEHCSFPPKGA